MDCLVSVIIPVYNVEKYLEQCIESVLNQDYTRLEIILIDDGSTDSSSIICDRFCNIDERVKCIHIKNGGQGRARNIGINEANGKYIYFLDSDDFIDTELFSNIIPYMEKMELDICFFSAKVLLEDGQSWNVAAYTRKETYVPKSGKEIFVELNQNKEYSPSNCLCVFRIDCIKSNHIMVQEGIYYEDNYFLFQLLMKSRLVGVLNQSFYFRRVHAGSTMTHEKNYQKKIESLIEVCRGFIEYESVNDKVDFFKNEIINVLLGTAIVLANESRDKRLCNLISNFINEMKIHNLIIRLKILLFLKLKLNHKKVGELIRLIKQK